MIRLIIFSLLYINIYAIQDLNTSPTVSLQNDPLFHAQREEGISVYDAIQRAIAHSPKIKAANEVVIQDKEKLNEAKSYHLPTIDLTGDTGREIRQLKTDDSNPQVLATSTTKSTYKKVDVYLAINENLWAGGSIENSIDEKDANLKASLFNYRDKLEALVEDTVNAYFQLVYAEIALKISEKNMKNYEKILKIVSIKEKNGAATTGDVNFIRANVDNARTELVQRQKTLSDAKAMYEYLLQTKDKELMPYEVEHPLYSADLNTSLNDAQQYNARLLAQKAYIKSTKLGFLAIKGKFSPKIDLSLNAESRDQFDVSTGQTNKLNALITFSYNLYSGGRDEANAIRLLSKMREQKFLYQDLQRNLKFDIRVLNRSLSSLNQSLALTQSEVLASRKVVDSYWIAFQHGTQDLQALQLAQRNLNSAEQNYAQYKRDLILNNFSLMRKTGVLLKFIKLPYKKHADEFQGSMNLFYGFDDLK